MKYILRLMQASWAPLNLLLVLSYRPLALTSLALALAAASGAMAQESQKGFEEIRRFTAIEARQAVAVDGRYFYAIGNRSIGKYDKHSGQRVGTWEGPRDGPIVHLNSGVVLDGLLYCAHSNFPGLPMVSSIEIFQTETLEHVGSHSFGMVGGSATWIDRRDGYWWVAFAHYAGRGGEPGKGPEWTTLLKFDQQWHRVGGYNFPPKLVEQFAGMSNAGGAWGEDGRLYATGHDRGEVYVLSLPEAGSVLVLEDILPVTTEGQGIAWDRSEPGSLYTILRSSREVVVYRLR